MGPGRPGTILYIIALEPFVALGELLKHVISSGLPFWYLACVNDVW